MMYAAGIDVGSTQTKGIILNDKYQYIAWGRAQRRMPESLARNRDALGPWQQNREGCATSYLTFEPHMAT